jgi:DNA-binding MarR family transcriptional regulator
MEQLLLEFIDTLDAALKAKMREQGETSGLAKLTISQLQYLQTVHRLGSPTITEVALHLKFSKASVTAGINHLVQAGYLEKTPSPTDKRSFHVKLSQAGSSLVQAKAQTVQFYGGFIRSALTSQEFDQFEHILAKLVQQFKQA